MQTQEKVSLHDPNKELVKRRILSFFKGCGRKKCLSRDCFSYLKHRDELDNYRSDRQAGVQYVIEKAQENNLRIFCAEDKNFGDIIDESLEQYQEIIRFNFVDVLNLDLQSMQDYFIKLRGLTEKLHKERHDQKVKIVEMVDKNLKNDCLALGDIFKDEIKDEQFFMLICYFVYTFFFLFEVYTFTHLKNVLSLLKVLNFGKIYHKNFKIYFRKNPLFTKSYTSKIEEALQNTIALRLIKEESLLKLADKDIMEIEGLLNLLMLLYNVNLCVPENDRIPKEDFYNDEVDKTETDLKHQILSFIGANVTSNNNPLAATLSLINQKKLYNNFNILRYPFLFSVEKKVELLSFENRILQSIELQNVVGNGLNIFALLQGGLFLELNLRRNNLLEDTLNQLHNKSSGNALKRGLKIKFYGEPGVDEGGLTKEFFQLLTKQLFDPHFGMFSVKNERYLWFNSSSFECSVNFELVGILLGIAVYNSILLELNFPLLVYKKLKVADCSTFIEDEITLEDIKEFEPELYTTLYNLRNKNFTNMETGVTFAINYEYWGVIHEHELLPNGSSIDVTEQNKEEFINLYLDWYVNESIKKQFDPFYKGFKRVMTGDIIKMFSGEELFKALCGTEELDFNAFKESTKYDDGYTENSESIKHFWKVLLEEFTIDQKKHFLKFLTGSDRAPLKGLGDIKMTISRYGDGDHLPSAHTCFNHLLLPDYKNYDKLKAKLLHAIEHSEGFGLF